MRDGALTIQRRSVTRGHGLLEGFLARRRAHRADSLIPQDLRAGRILDIGCGSFPAFLIGCKFHERYGLDRIAVADVEIEGVHLVEHDVANGSGLPFESTFFDVVTMLAVFEHLDAPAVARETPLAAHGPW